MKHNDREDDRQAVADASAALQVSEFELFQLAYRNWFGRSSEQKVLSDAFSRYLGGADAPMWVRDLTRRVQRSTIAGDLNPSDYGIAARTWFHRPRPLACGAIAAGMLGVLVLLIYLAMRAQSLDSLVCFLPPCY